MAAVNTSALRQNISETINNAAPTFKNVVGPNGAARIIQLLCHTEWLEDASSESGTITVSIAAVHDTTILADIIRCIADELTWGSQIETEFAKKLDEIADALTTYVESGRRYRNCASVVDAALGLAKEPEETPVTTNISPRACACGATPIVDFVTDSEVNIHCPECLASVTSTDYNTATDKWNRLADENEAALGECCRCGEPAFPDGFVHPGTEQTYCRCCAEDVFGI